MIVNSQIIYQTSVDRKDGREYMRRSKLESYEAILEVLVQKPSTADGISFETSMDCKATDRYIDFLIKNGLVEERYSGSKMLYAVTERGVAVFKALNFQKYLEKVTKSLMAMEEALQIMPIITKRTGQQEEKETE
jgi:predicted transcriptional regulator